MSSHDQISFSLVASILTLAKCCLQFLYVCICMHVYVCEHVYMGAYVPHMCIEVNRGPWVLVFRFLTVEMKFFIIYHSVFHASWPARDSPVTISRFSLRSTGIIDDYPLKFTCTERQ